MEKDKAQSIEVTEAPKPTIVADSVSDEAPHLVELASANEEHPTGLNLKSKSARQDPLLGSLLAERYCISSLIGKGATSRVYKAEDVKLKQVVAVKVLHEHLIADEAIVRRFDQEVKTASILAHPNIVPIHDSGSTDAGQPFLIMDYVDGQTLQELIREGHGLETRRSVNIFQQICAALAAAHEKGVIHRDLKPGNLMIHTDDNGKDFVEVLDFGIAKIMPVQGETFMRLTQSGETLGSLLYMSPEQCLDQDLDARSDIYSLGCLMYESLTGKSPLSARTAFETMNKHMTEMPQPFNKVRPDLGLSSQLESIVFKCVAKKPEERYQSIAEVQNELECLLMGKPLTVPPRTIPVTIRRDLPTQPMIEDIIVRTLRTERTEFQGAVLTLMLAVMGCLTGLLIQNWLLFGLALVLVLGLCHLVMYVKRYVACIECAAAALRTTEPVQTVITEIRKSGPFHLYYEVVPADRRLVSPPAETRIRRKIEDPDTTFVQKLRLSPAYLIEAIRDTSTDPFTGRSADALKITTTEKEKDNWEVLCAASKTELLRNEGTFAVPAAVYVDPKSGEAVAVVIDQMLVWCVRWN